MKIFLIVLLLSLSAVCPRAASALDVNGFVEGAYGYRTEDDTTEKDEFNLGEARLELKGSHSPKILPEWYPEFVFKVDLLADGYEDRLRLIVRDAALSFTPTDIVDVKLGRQILTWGTGDMVFVNDLFPKDYISFFSGRDEEYLKIPNDAVKVSVFTGTFSLDLVLIPVMEANQSVVGERFSFYNGLSGGIVGADGDVDYIEPPRTPRNSEAALRLYRGIGSYEAALYAFRGFYKQPRGVLDPSLGDFFYPRLGVYGASLRGPALGGIFSLEAGYYDSREDSDGTDPLVENSSIKYLAAFTRDMGGDLNLGLQYLIEDMEDYDEYLGGLSSLTAVRDERRGLATLRIIKLFKEQTVEAGLFAFYSPTDEDAYLRPAVSYKVTDAFKASAGANIFIGNHDHTEFGQFDRNDNLYVRLRYSF